MRNDQLAVLVHVRRHRVDLQFGQILDVLVHANVCGQPLRVVESLLAHGAALCLLRVRVAMGHKLPPRLETLAANVAVKGLFARVRQHVLLERAFLAESRAAHFTDKRFVARVDALMGIQIGNVAETLVAVAATVRSFIAAVRRFMHLNE